MIYQVNLGLQSTQAMMLINVLGYTPLKRKRVKGKYNLFGLILIYPRLLSKEIISTKTQPESLCL